MARENESAEHEAKERGVIRDLAKVEKIHAGHMRDKKKDTAASMRQEMRLVKRARRGMNEAEEDEAEEKREYKPKKKYAGKLRRDRPMKADKIAKEYV